MKIIFDTSIINKINNDPRRDEVIQRIVGVHESFVSILNVGEICANKDSDERVRLLEVCRLLCRGNNLIVQPEELLWRILSSYINDESSTSLVPSDEDWVIWELMNNPDQINEESRSQIIDWTKSQKNWFKEMNDAGRPSMQAATTTLNNRVAIFIKSLIQNESFLIEILHDLVKDKYGDCLVGREMDILSNVEVWRFYLIAMIVGIYNLSIKTTGFSHKKNAGSIDLRQAAYLSVGDVFVTHDKSQMRTMRIVEKFGFTRRYIWSYSQLMKALSFNEY